MSKEATTKLTGVPSTEDICLKYPLYDEFTFDGESPEHEEALRILLHGATQFDAHCLGCQRASTFHRRGYSREFVNHLTLFSAKVHQLEYTCTRSPSLHSLIFILQVKGKTLTKIGQFPSLADISKGELDRYRKALGKDRFSEFNRAIGLASHGVGIGAFIYLRRVFEAQINDAYLVAKSASGWNDETYSMSRMAEKIQMLSPHLPPFLVENRGIYGIMSKAVHSLTESECLEAFPVIKIAIELILDQKIQEIDRAEKLKTVKAELAALQAKSQSA